jgi:hypothetical protein
MTRTDIINSFIIKYGYKSYLEIGVENPNNNFNKVIDVPSKHGVDPQWLQLPSFGKKHNCTSDSFFKKWGKGTVDIIFIDVLHTSALMAHGASTLVNNNNNKRQ